MKRNVLELTKSAAKYFFDIDPVLTEHMVVQTVTHAQALQQKCRFAIRLSLLQSRAGMVRLLRNNVDSQHWNAA